VIDFRTNYQSKARMPLPISPS